MKSILFSLLFSFGLLQSYPTLAWGNQGHEIVVSIAVHYLSPAAQIKLRTILGNMKPEQAATWMDSMRGNKAFDYMKPWHYINIEKGKSYVAGGNNIITELNKVYTELLHWKTLPKSQQQTDMAILIHLMGDLHLPLHVGYAIDEGGNKIAVVVNKFNTDLHHVWDGDIIWSQHITAAACLAMKDPKAKPGPAFDPAYFVTYMKESRTLLPAVYAFTGGQITPAYIQQNKTVVMLQLLHAGKRLALVLEKILA